MQICNVCLHAIALIEFPVNVQLYNYYVYDCIVSDIVDIIIQPVTFYCSDVRWAVYMYRMFISVQCIIFQFLFMLSSNHTTHRVTTGWSKGG